MANKNNVSTGVEKLKAAAKNPANSKMFDAFITGELNENVVDSLYMSFDIDFSNEEVESVCKLLTRGRIGAYQNDTNRSAEELISRYLDVVVDGDHVNDSIVEANMGIMTDVLKSVDPENTDDEMALIISAAAIFRNIFKVVLGTPVTVKEDVVTAANESVKVDSKVEETIKPEVVDEVVNSTKVLDLPAISPMYVEKLQGAFNDMMAGNLSKANFYKLAKEIITDEKELEKIKEGLKHLKINYPETKFNTVVDADNNNPKCEEPKTCKIVNDMIEVMGDIHKNMLKSMKFA